MADPSFHAEDLEAAIQAHRRAGSWADLAQALEAWRPVVAQAAASEKEAVRARCHCQLLGQLEATLIACALEQSDGPGAARHLEAARDHFEGALRGRGRRAGATAGKAPASAPFAGAVEDLVAAIPARLDDFATRPGASPVSIAALRSCLASRSDRLRALAPAFEGKERLSLLTTIRAGQVFQVQLAMDPSPFGIPMASPEVVSLGATVLEPSFLKAVDTALKAALKAYARRHGEAAPARWIRWRILDADGVPSLSDGSGGALFAAAFLGLLEGRSIDPLVGLTATVDAEGRMGGVDGIDRKADAALHRKAPIRTFILSPEDWEVWGKGGEHSKLARALGAPPGLQVLQAATVEEALDHLSSERRAVLELLAEIAGGECVLGMGTGHVRFRPKYHAGPIRDVLIPPCLVEVEDSAKVPGASTRGPARRRIDEGLEDGHVALGADGVLEGLSRRAAAPRTFILEGDGGSGKSTLLWRQVALHAEAIWRGLLEGRFSHRDPEVLVPLGLPLRRLRDAALTEAESGLQSGAFRLVERALGYTRGLLTRSSTTDPAGSARRADALAWLERKARAKRPECVLYLDGYDELNPEPAGGGGRSQDGMRFNAGLEALAGVDVVLTTRPVPRSPDLRAPKRLRAAPLRWEDILEYLELCFPGPHRAKGEALRDSLRQTPGPRSLVSIPLFLALLRESAEDGQPMEFNGAAPRTKLLRLAIRRLLERAKEEERLRLKIAPAAAESEDWEGLFEEWINHLARTARDHYDGAPRSIPMDALKAALTLPEGSELKRVFGNRIEMVQACLDAGLLAHADEPGRVDIVLRTIHEHLVARHLVHSKSSRTWRTLPLSGEGWRNVWPFVVGELEDPAGQAAGLEALWEARRSFGKKRSEEYARHLAMVARAAAEATPGGRAAIEDELVGTLSDWVVEDDERPIVFGALLELGTDPAAERLAGWIRTAPEGDDYLRIEAIDALAGSGNPTVTGAMTEVLRRPDAEELYDIRERCAAALGSLGLPHDFHPPPGSDLGRAVAAIRRGRSRGRPEPFDPERLTAAAVASLEGHALKSQYTKIAPSTYEHQETGVVFLLIPAGEFRMGSPPGERERYSNEEQHIVQLRPFLLARHAMPSAVYARFRDGKAGKPVPEKRQAKSLPQVDVSWEEAMAFCRRFGWTLPSEAQWEYACRAGTTTRFAFGDELSPEDANFDESNRGGPCAVGEYRPNALGLYQMHGNVWEWCRDVYSGTYYAREEARGPDPVCRLGSWGRVLRGGCYWADARRCRSARRSWYPAFDRDDYIGFRPSRPLL